MCWEGYLNTMYMRTNLSSDYEVLAYSNIDCLVGLICYVTVKQMIEYLAPGHNEVHLCHANP